MKKLLVLALLAVMAISLLACSKQTEVANVINTDSQAEGEKKEEPKAEEPKAEEPKEEAKTDDSQAEIPAERIVSFDFDGSTKEVTIPGELNRVVVIGYDVLDIVDSLGFKDTVVGVVDPSNPMFPKYLENYEGVTSIGSLRGDDLEAIAGLKPDAIIAGARTFGVYDSLNEIAPTVWFSIPGMESGFEEKLVANITMLGEIFNANDKAADLVADVKGKIAEVKEKVASIENKSTLFLSITGKELAVYSDDVSSRYGFVYNEFGFEIPASLEEIQNDAATHGNSISFEFISSKNPNYLIVLDRGATTGETDIKASDTLDNPLIAATDAVKNGNVIYIDGTSWYLGNGGYKSTQIMIDNLLSQLK